MGYR
jgi:hypothetical protein